MDSDSIRRIWGFISLVTVGELFRFCRYVGLFLLSLLCVIVFCFCFLLFFSFKICVFYPSLLILGLDFQSYLSGLDFLPQLTTGFPVKRNPVGSSTQGIRSSPLHALVGSPIKEEEEHPETDIKKMNLGKQETKEALKQVYCANSCYECFLASDRSISTWRKDS